VSRRNILLVIELVRGLKKHWLLRGVFQKMNSQTNAPAAKPPTSNIQPAKSAEPEK
jgi:hypothetical protein